METEKETICKMSFVHDVCFDHREKIQNIKITRVTTWYLLYIILTKPPAEDNKKKMCQGSKSLRC